MDPKIKEQIKWAVLKAPTNIIQKVDMAIELTEKEITRRADETDRVLQRCKNE